MGVSDNVPVVSVREDLDTLKSEVGHQWDHVFGEHPEHCEETEQ